VAKKQTRSNWTQEFGWTQWASMVMISKLLRTPFDFALKSTTMDKFLLKNKFNTHRDFGPQQVLSIWKDNGG
jgi:hypothetical protein